MSDPLQKLMDCRLSFDDFAERPSTVRVLVGQPQQEASGPDWSAPYEIPGPGADEVRYYYAMGVHAMQALILALQNLPLWLEELPSLGRLRWIGGEGDDTGFEGLVVLGAPAKDYAPPATLTRRRCAAQHHRREGEERQERDGAWHLREAPRLGQEERGRRHSPPRQAPAQARQVARGAVGGVFRPRLREHPWRTGARAWMGRIKA